LQSEKKYIFTYPIKNFTVSRIVNGVFRENCFLIKHNETGELLLFDPGDDLERIESVISDNGDNLKGILLTHGHFDHVGQVGAIAKKFNLIAKIHKNDFRLMRQAPMYAIRFIRKILEPPSGFETFEEETSLKIGIFSVDITRTPGHTSGSVCFYVDGILITGDTLFFRHIGPTNYPESQPDIFPKSIDKLLSKYPDDTIIFPGHGKEWNIKEAKEWWELVGENIPQYQIMNDKELQGLK
jgi:hydroxyacylglutathione hydrolase